MAKLKLGPIADDKPVKRIRDLAVILDSKKPGDKLKLGVLRDDEKAEVEVTLGEAE